MRLIQFENEQGQRQVGVVTGERISVVKGIGSTRELALQAIRNGRGLIAEIEDLGVEAGPAYAELLEQRRVLAPLDHADPAHCLVSGTGLTHLGSAAARDAMHQHLKQQVDTAITDSMQMFQWGLKDGIPDGDVPGAQPEWFYKGDGSIVVAPGAPLPSPDFALDAGEEPELVGLYVIAPDGTPRRLGFAIGNEFSDHVTERQNYLYLAHSKLRACAIGPELRSGELPTDLRGSSRIRRGDQVIWEKPFLTGEANMCHSLANLEYHHFKYPAHRRPGDVHLHFFGTATLSFADDVRTREGDRFEIELPALGAALVNPLRTEPAGFVLGGVSAL